MKKLIEQADALIAKGQYESAYKTVSQFDNEYLISKATYICINYFAYSITHQFFTLKDLEEGGTLYDVRMGECKSKLPQDYRIVQNEVALHAKQKNQKKLLNAAKELYAMAPENPSAPQMVLREYFDGGVEEWLPEFFDSCLKDYDSIGARQNLFYHYAYVLYEMGQADKAFVMAKNAKAEF